MFINITDSETGNNKGSSRALVQYLEKENRIKTPDAAPEFWFNGIRNDIIPQEVRVSIDNNIAKLGKNDAKFYLINISPSQQEINHLREHFGEIGMLEKLKDYAVTVMDEYACNFKRTGVDSNRDLLWYGRLEHYRYYGHNDPEVKDGRYQEGDRKEGDQIHIQIIVSRKDITNKIKLSPMNNSRGINTAHSAKLGQFDRTAFKQAAETSFDTLFKFKRNVQDSLAYAITMNGGSTEEKKLLHARTTFGDIKSSFQEKNEQVASQPPTLAELLPQDDIVLGELVGSLLPQGNNGTTHDDLDLQHPKKRKKRRPPRQNP